MLNRLFKIVSVKFNLLLITIISIFSFTANAASHDAFSHLEMKTADDSVFLMDCYNRLRNDKQIASPTVQEHKTEVLIIVNAIIDNKKRKDSVDLMNLLLPDCKLFIGSRMEEIEDNNTNGTNQKGHNENEDNDVTEEPTDYKIVLTYVTVKGDTVEKELGKHLDFATKMAKQIESLNDKFGEQDSSDNKFRYGDMVLTVFNMVLSDDTKEMDRFMNETKQNFIHKELAQYSPKGLTNNEPAIVALNTKTDSISFAKGYFAGKSTADTLTFKDNYDFLEGTSMGYKASKINIGKIGWIQIMGILESRPLASQELFMLGFAVGGEGEKNGYEPTYIPGAYFGYAGVRTQWSETDMKAFLKKNDLEPSSLFGTWTAYKVEMDDNGTNKISEKDRKQSTKKILKYKIQFIDDLHFKFNKVDTKRQGTYYIKKKKLTFYADSDCISFNENKTVAQIISEKSEFTILSRTENEMVLCANDNYYNYTVKIYFRKQ